MHKIGILGAAGIAPRAIIEPVRRRDDVVIHAVASRREGSAQAYADEHGIARAHDGYDALVTDPEITIVYNALPPSEHARWTIAALEAGKHVLCEKPFAMNVAEAENMVATAERCGLRLLEAFHDRYHPLFLHVLALKETGRLGAISALEAEFAVSIPFHPEAIRHVPALGGGALMDLGCYPVHWVRALTGEEPEVVSASGRPNPLGVDEQIEASLRFPSGITAEIRTDMADGIAFKALLTIHCEHGKVEVENPVLPHEGHCVREWLEGGFRHYTIGAGTTYDYQLDAMLKAVDEGAKVPTDGADSINNMAVIAAIYDKAGFAPR